MKACRSIAALLVGCAATVGPSWAQRQSAPDAPRSRFGDPTSIARIYQTYIYGVVKKVSKSQMILDKTKFGDDQAFELTKDTKFIRDGKPSRTETLKAGEMVWVDMKRDKKTRDMIAKKVVTGVAPTGAPE